MCGHIDNYTSRTLVYKESRFSDGKLSASPPRNTAPGDSVTFKARAEGQTITFELCFGFEGRQDLGVLTLVRAPKRPRFNRLLFLYTTIIEDKRCR